MKSKLIVLMLSAFVCPHISSQIKVDNLGRVGVGTLSPETYRQMTIDIDGDNFSGGVHIDGTELAAWEKAIEVNVSNPATLSYGLSYNNNDRFYVAAAGWLWCYLGGYFGSDINMKTNITEINNPLDKVMNLHGVSFENKEDLGTTRTGVIAQEVENVLPGAIRTMNDGSKAVSYNDIIGLLIEAIKEQQKQINDLRGEIESSKQSSSDLKSSVDETINANTKSTLFQNSPNPFNQDTQIKLFISQDVMNSSIYIFDMQGIQVRSYNVQDRGATSITISGSELDPGMYTYTLITDNKEVDTKRLILTR